MTVQHTGPLTTGPVAPVAHHRNSERAGVGGAVLFQDQDQALLLRPSPGGCDPVGHIPLQAMYEPCHALAAAALIRRGEPAAPMPTAPMPAGRRARPPA